MHTILCPLLVIRITNRTTDYGLDFGHGQAALAPCRCRGFSGVVQRCEVGREIRPYRYTRAT